MVSINRDYSNRASSWIQILVVWISLVLCYANHQTVTVDEQGNAYVTSQELEVSDEYDINHEPTLSNEHYYNDGASMEEDDHGNYFQDSNTKSAKSIIVVTTVDGSIAGLSRDTGKVLWKHSGFSSTKQSEFSKPIDIQEAQHVNDSFRVRSPLVSTTTTVRSSRYDSRTAAVPSVDGQVFLTDGADLTATSTIAELVARAPFIDARGRFYVGSRSALAIALNRDTGDIVRLVDPNSDFKENQDAPDSSDSRATTMRSTLIPNLHEGQTNGNENLIWFGRVDYSISIFDARSGAMDVKFSSSEIKGIKEMMLDDADSPQSTTHNHQESTLLLPDSKDSSQNTALLVATPNGNVALRNTSTGSIEWVSNETFDTPVAFAVETSTGSSLYVDILPDAPSTTNTSPDYIATQLKSQMDRILSSEDPEQTIVGALSSGQLFAMPLGKKLSQIKRLLSAIGPPHSTSSAIALESRKQIAQHKVPFLGKSIATGLQSRRMDEPSKKTISAKKSCQASHPNFPACLVGGIHSYHEIASSKSFLDQEAHLHSTSLLHFQDIHSMQSELKELQKFRKTKRNFFKLMASWLPPTMVLLFLVSFEMGRRIKAKKRKERESELQSSKFSVETMNSVMDNSHNGGRNIGVIQVTDQVLGFGGHGTVVYRGTLDGRQVAVKRMLKAYHASADREISLLIESDGHPNVVRYFLKEIKGDFVYLALELCDISLQDLVVKLRLCASSNMISVFQGVVKATLYQIACGVRHLHSLRIVHRDLKPANILLALKSGTNNDYTKSSECMPQGDEIMMRYEKGALIAKISDMGLGKQLTGQSSHDLSTLGNSSIQGSSHDPRHSSRLTGAGPGSIGWQAPEVMAIRWSVETPSVKSGNCNDRAGPWMESSPLDVGMGLRTSRSVDIFSLGCIFHYTLIPGSHPFGDWYEREANIMRNRMSTEELLQISPEAHDLITSMISRDHSCRPSATEVCEHPYFWQEKKKLAFLCEFSDRVEIDAQIIEDGRIAVSKFSANIFAIESNASRVVGIAWDQSLDPDLISNTSKFRSYDTSSVRDCLRLIRNKHHHYDELPNNVKEAIGSNPDGLLTYFENRFPLLFMHCYNMCKDNMEIKDQIVQKYLIPIKCPTKPRETLLNTGSEISPDENATSHHDSISETSRKQPQGDYESIDENVNEVEDTISSTVMTLENENRVICDASAECINQNSLESCNNSPALLSEDVIIWEGSTAAKTFKCRGWLRADEEWIRRGDAIVKKMDNNLMRCATDPKFRTRLCNHWDSTLGTFCPMLKRHKCIFAHGPVELRVKEGKKTRWGKLVDSNGNCSNSNHSGGEDTYGAARSIEAIRKDEGKWNTEKTSKGKLKSKPAIPKGQ